MFNHEDTTPQKICKCFSFIKYVEPSFILSFFNPFLFPPSLPFLCLLLPLPPLLLSSFYSLVSNNSVLSAITHISSRKHTPLVWIYANLVHLKWFSLSQYILLQQSVTFFFRAAFWFTDFFLLIVSFSHHVIQKQMWRSVSKVCYPGRRAAGTMCVPPCLVCWLQAEWDWRLWWSWRRPCCHLRSGSPAPGWLYTGPTGRQMSSLQCSLPHSRTLPPEDKEGGTQGLSPWAV